MRRISSDNRAVGLFGAGKDGFKAAVPGVAPATELTPEWFNAIQEAIARTIEAAGLALSALDYDQFTNAVQQLISNGVAAVVNSAPATLATLKGLADALNDDPNFAATMAAQLATKESFASGTRLLFQQTAAPVGWTKITDQDNKALRVVSGVAGSGGTVNFTTVFSNGSVGGTALTIAQMPSHSHQFAIDTYIENGTGTVASGSNTTAVEVTIPFTTAPTGGDQPHTHTINLDVKYVDIIIASKN